MFISKFYTFYEFSWNCNSMDFQGNLSENVTKKLICFGILGRKKSCLIHITLLYIKYFSSRKESEIRIVVNQFYIVTEKALCDICSNVYVNNILTILH